MSKSGFRDSPPAPSCAVNSCYRLDQPNLWMVGCKVILRNEMISYSRLATLMRSFKSLKQAFYQHENNSTSSGGLMDACFYCAVLLKWLKRTVLNTVRSVNPMPEFESLRPRQSFSRRAYIIPVPYHRLKGRFYNAGDSADVLTSLISCVWVGLTPTPAPSISPFASLPSVFYSLWR